ncbi:MAG: hypothetical protein MJZ99_08905 [Bacteroidales bacterium]|nr:hypothetical protein [Candidatus Colimorpha merdihippi]MCQ2282726.1 hypothetical protein [Bacteroidales bacterium]
MSLISKAFKSWRKRSAGRKIFDIVVGLFALAGFAIIGAWAVYQLGFTKNRGAVDKNYRYMLSVDEMKALQDSTLTQEQVQERWMRQYAKLAVFSKFYPTNAQLITQAAQFSHDPMLVDRMMAACSMYIDDNSEYDKLLQQVNKLLDSYPQKEAGNVIPWMTGVEWDALKEAITRDKALIIEAGRLTGVEPRLIVGCLIGEQIRLFNSKRETFKKYLGPVKVLSVQSQFSYGVNGIKISTAKTIEQHLKDPNSEYYMGKRYEHLLDYTVEGQAQEDERYNRLVDYRNHLYSYLYTACILHQTKVQWERAGFDISNRPDILFTLFNVGFSQSIPKADPVCGGSHIKVHDQIYTFGAIGFDFYFSGELAEDFPFWREHFIPGDKDLTEEELAYIQGSVSNCKRPPRGSEYLKKDSVQTPQDRVYTFDDDDEYAGTYANE